MLFVIILRTQVFSASALSMAAAATIPRNPRLLWCPGTLASGNEQHVPVRPYASDSPLVLSPLLGRSSASPIHAWVPLFFNAPMTNTALWIDRTALISSQKDSTSAQPSSHFIVSFVIGAMHEFIDGKFT
ncbi:hypothetical protein BGY98DRAFT_632602 [Russula aff. rugulosa BPL654]|nr:hypothetical protein BGY98DRAFT_632602 [Russula aff. rugulosa BPL654]